MVNEPFSLGIPGEEWNSVHGWLSIPVDANHKVIIMTELEGKEDRFLVVTSMLRIECENILMAACVVSDFIANYHGG